MRLQPSSDDSKPGSSSTSPLAWWVLAVAVLVWGWNSLQYLDEAFDDLFITFAYALEWLERGAPAWTTGEQTEGFSNLLLVLVAYAAMAVGADPVVVTKVVSLCSGLALLLFIGRRLPHSWPGALALLAIAGWAPLGYWSANGMETATFTLMLCLAWWWGARPATWSAGALVAALSTLCRPEGIVHLAAITGFRLATGMPVSRSDVGAGLAGVVILLFFGWRWVTFGSLSSSPYLVKVAAMVPGGWGVLQAGTELASGAAILLAVAFVVTVTNPRQLAMVVAPAAIQLLLLLRINGDWFGMARLLAPGLLATAVVGLRLGNRPGLRLPVALVAVVVVGSWAMEPRSGPSSYHLVRRAATTALKPWREPLRGVEVPLRSDVWWLVHEAPADAQVLMSDVGMPGHVPRVGIWDTTGLTWRDVALYRANRDPEAAGRMRAFTLSETAPVFAIRLLGAEPPAVGDDEVAARFPKSSTFLRSDAWSRWISRDVPPPDADLVEYRFRLMADRFPSIPWLSWQHALALAELGRYPEALEVSRASARVFPTFRPWLGLPASLLFTTGGEDVQLTDDGMVRIISGTPQRTRPLAPAEQAQLTLTLDVEAPGKDGAEVALRWVEPCRGAGVVVTVRQRGTVTPPQPDCPGDAARLEVTLLNDDLTSDGDRNLLLSLPPSTSDLPALRTLPLPPQAVEVPLQSAEVVGGPAEVDEEGLHFYGNGVARWAAPTSGLVEVELRGDAASGITPRPTVATPTWQRQLESAPSVRTVRLSPVDQGTIIELRYEDDLAASGQDRNLHVQALRIVGSGPSD